MDVTEFYVSIIILLSGPHHWHKLFPDACSGKHQSPIDIRPEETIYNPDLKNFAIWYDPPKQNSKMYIINNGHTVQVNLEGDFYVSNAGLPNVYKMLQFHFHWGHKAHHGSEHLINGQPSPIELHLVTYNHELYSDIGQAVRQKGGLAVLGVMFEISSEDNPALDTIIEALTHIRNPEHHHKAELPLMSLRDFLPEDISRYYRYNGSLTTPGCFESVIWTIFDDTQTISHKQLKEFTKILQFKHEQGHGKGAEGSRHRRSLTKSEREKERRAGDVLDELGIRGNEFEEEILKFEILHENMMADMPQDNVVSRTEMTKTGSNSKSGEDRTTKTDLVNDDYAAVNRHKKVVKSDHSKHEEEVKERESIYIQEEMVNNFRPVQPLNDRVVYRNFKLRDTNPPEFVHFGQSQLDDDDDSSYRQGNGVGYHRPSLAAATATLFVVSFIFL